MSFYFAQLARSSGVAVRGVVTALPRAHLPPTPAAPSEGEVTELVEAVEVVDSRPDDRPPPVASPGPARPHDALVDGPRPERDEAQPLPQGVENAPPDAFGAVETGASVASTELPAATVPTGEAELRLDPVVVEHVRLQDERPTPGEPFDAADLLRRAMQWVAAGSRDPGPSHDASARLAPVSPGAAADRPPPQEPETGMSGSVEAVGASPTREEDRPPPTPVTGTPAYLPPRPAEAWSAPDAAGPTAREETIEIRIGRIEVVVEAPGSPGPLQPARLARPERNSRPRDPERPADPRRSGLLPN